MSVLRERARGDLLKSLCFRVFCSSCGRSQAGCLQDLGAQDSAWSCWLVLELWLTQWRKPHTQVTPSHCESMNIQHSWGSDPWHSHSPGVVWQFFRDLLSKRVCGTGSKLDSVLHWYKTRDCLQLLCKFPALIKEKWSWAAVVTQPDTDGGWCKFCV